jgi:hypothetical protein
VLPAHANAPPPPAATDASADDSHGAAASVGVSGSGEPSAADVIADMPRNNTSDAGGEYASVTTRPTAGGAASLAAKTADVVAPAPLPPPPHTGLLGRGPPAATHAMRTPAGGSAPDAPSTTMALGSGVSVAEGVRGDGDAPGVALSAGVGDGDSEGDALVLTALTAAEREADGEPCRDALDDGLPTSSAD